MTDFKIVKTEYYDADMMDQLASHEGVSADVKKVLKAYKKLRVNANEVQVVYEYGKNLRKLKKGRVYPQKGLGLQAFPSDVRSALAKKNYWELDFVNSQPVILLAMCKEAGWECSKLESYVSERSSHLHQLQAELNCTRDEAKTMCLTVMFGGRPKNSPPFLLELAGELERIAVHVVGKNADILTVCSGERSPSASCLAHVCQDQEFTMLHEVSESLLTTGRFMDSYIHDGGLIRKADGESEPPIALLPALEKMLIEKFKCPMKLAFKPIEHSFLFNKDEMRLGSSIMGYISEKAYQERKNVFEEDHFYCMETATICTVRKDGLSHTIPKTAGIAFAEFNFQKLKGLKKNTFSFVNEWTQDPSKRVVDKLVFDPSSSYEETDSEFNLFMGFAGQEECDANVAIIRRFEELVYLNAGKDDVVYQYMLKWFALCIQKPEVIPGVALVFINDKQGTGKDTLCNFFGEKVVGSDYYKCIKDVEKELFSPHSMAFNRMVFMKLEEVNGSATRKYDDQLKGMVTATSYEINPKGINPYTLNVYPHIAMTTNRLVPVKVEKDDRRFCVSYTSSDRVGDREFWEETYRLFELPEAGRVVYHYLKEVNLAGYKVQDFPKTSYHDTLAETEVPSETVFLQQCAPFIDLSAAAFHDMYVLFCVEEKLTPKGVVHFSRAMAPHLSNGVITKRLLHGRNVYSKK